MKSLPRWMQAALALLLSGGAVAALSLAVGRMGKQLRAERSITRVEVEAAQGATLHAPVDEERFLGVAVAREAVDVSSRLEGRIKEIYVDVGDHVKANARLVLLDDAPIRRDLALAQAVLQGADAVKSKASLELHDAQDRNERRKSVQTELSQEEMAQSQLKEKLGGANLAAARAEVAEKRARIAQLMEQLRTTDIRAPFDGTVSMRYQGPGSLVGPRTPILRLIQSDEMLVRFAVPVGRTRALPVGTPVEIDVEVSSVPLPGRVEHIAPEVDPASQMVFLEASISVPGDWKSKVQSGMVAHVAVAAVADPEDRGAHP